MVNVSNQLVSIALCTYNGERFLKQQLDTLVNQSYKNLEIVIVDDVSSDHTIAIIEEYTAQDPRVKLYKNEHNLGYVKNFEKAISLCTGDFIALSDQDDVWDLKKIEILVNEIGSNMLIYHNSQLIDESGKVLGLMSDVLDMYHGNSPMPFVFYNCLSGHACMFKKALQPHLVNFDPNYYHDWFIAFAAASFGPIKYLDTPLVSYRQHSQAITDMLPLKANANTQQAPATRYSEFNPESMRYLAQVNGSVHKDLNEIIYLFEHNTSLANSLKLFGLLLKHYKDLYFYTNATPMKKSDLSRINYIRKASFFKGFVKN